VNGIEVDAKVKNTSIYTSTVPYVFIAYYINKSKYGDNFTFLEIEVGQNRIV
jgi:hypothetical protein